MMWVLKRTTSMRQFFWVPKTYARNYGLANIYNFMLKIFVYLNLWKYHIIYTEILFLGGNRQLMRTRFLVCSQGTLTHIFCTQHEWHSKSLDKKLFSAVKLGSFTCSWKLLWWCSLAMPLCLSTHPPIPCVSVKIQNCPVDALLEKWSKKVIKFCCIHFKVLLYHATR